MKTLFWLVLICLVAAGVVVGQDQVGPQSTVEVGTELATATEEDAPVVVSDPAGAEGAEAEGVLRCDPVIAYEEVRYTVVDRDDIPGGILNTIEKTKSNPTTMVFDGEQGSQYVYIALGERPTGGYLISIEGVEAIGERVYVRYSEIKPGVDDLVTLALTYPWIVLKVQSELPIEVTIADAGQVSVAGEPVGQEAL